MTTTIPLKSKKEIELLEASGHILNNVMRLLEAHVKAGITTKDIDNIAEERIYREKAIPAFKGYRGFPASICASINDEIVHGIPSKRKLKDGDILSLDLGVNYKGYFSDAAVTIAVGEVAPRIKELIETTKNALFEGIKQAKVNNHLYDISCAIQAYVEERGFSVVRQFVGHGIGSKLHEEPEIPNFGFPRQGPLLKNGMVLAIEPMVNIGTWEAEILDNGWTAVTKDGEYSAHFEHTVAITDNGTKILTN
jgi:methionyl aminopeptidase